MAKPHPKDRQIGRSLIITDHDKPPVPAGEKPAAANAEGETKTTRPSRKRPAVKES